MQPEVAVPAAPVESKVPIAEEEPLAEVPAQPEREQPQRQRQERVKKNGLKRPATAVMVRSNEVVAEPADGALGAAVAVEALPAAPVPAEADGGYLAGPSGKRFRKSTVDQQSTLGCSKCVMAKNGCARCIEIHRMWKDRNNVA